MDDYVDLETLRTVAEHPPFARSDLETPIPSPEPISEPPESRFSAPPSPPKGLGGLFGKKKHAEEVAKTQADHAQRASKNGDAKSRSFRHAVRQQPTRTLKAEAKRVTSLEEVRTQYAEECDAGKPRLPPRTVTLTS